MGTDKFGIGNIEQDFADKILLYLVHGAAGRGEIAFHRHFSVQNAVQFLYFPHKGTRIAVGLHQVLEMHNKIIGLQPLRVEGVLEGELRR